MSPTESLIAYLRAYEAKDLWAIEVVLSENVRLQDWNLVAEGKAAVLAETSRNFSDATTLAIEVIRIFEHENCAAAELNITVNETIKLLVVDSLCFTPDGKIETIRAYKG